MRPQRTIRLGAALCAVVAAGWGPRAHADDARPGAGRAAPRPSDVFEGLSKRVLPRADTVVVGTARVVREGIGGAATVVAVTVEEVLKGSASGSITVFLSGPRNTADPANPSAPWFPDARPHRCALFLRTAPNGSGYGLETLFFADGPEGAEKVEVLAKEVRILGIPDAPTRRRRALAHLLDLVGGDRAWSRAHASKELEVLVDVAPELFDAEARTELHAARRKSFDPATRAALSRILSRLSQTGEVEGGDARAPGRVEPTGEPIRPPPPPPPSSLPPPPPVAPECPSPAPSSPGTPPAFPPPPPPPTPLPMPPSPAPPEPVVPLAAPPPPLPLPAESSEAPRTDPGGPLPTPAPPPPVAVPAPKGQGLSAEYLRARRRIAEVKDTEGRLAGLSELARLGKAGAGPDLLAAFGSEDPLLRERAAVLLGDVGAVEAWATLRSAFPNERVPEVREALVRAGGLLGDARTVPWVVTLLEDGALRTSALMALARLRTPAALAVLADRQQEALSATPPDEATARLLSYLRSPEFEAAERAVGRSIGPRRGSSAPLPAPAPSSPVVPGSESPR